MHTDVHIFENANGSGSLTAVTHTWEVTELRGFRGAVAVALLDENKIPLWVSGTQNYGVDGVLTGAHDRRENWSETVPAQFMPQIRYIAIIQKWNPKNEFDDIHGWLQRIGQNAGRGERNVGQAIGRELAAIVKAVRTIVK